MRKILSILLVVICLAACGGPSSGTVVEKDHDAAYTYTTYIWVNKVMVPQNNYVPESWSILVENSEEKGWVSVDEDTFDELELGDYFQSN